MKIEDQNGAQIIILEENDRIKIRKPDSSKTITVERNGKSIDIIGGAELIGSIKGTGMLEKIYIPPVVSSQEIIYKCDKWLEMFKKIHDEFKFLASMDEYREQNVVMELSFPLFFSYEDSNINGRKIYLDLKQYSTIVQDGGFIAVDAENQDVYAYLVANVLDYYLSQNYKDTKINNTSMNYNDILYSNDQSMMANLTPLMESYVLSSVVNSIIGAHNLGVSAEQIIDNLRKNIANQQLGESFDSGISYTERQLEHIIIGDNENVPVKKLTIEENNK